MTNRLETPRRSATVALLMLGLVFAIMSPDAAYALPTDGLAIHAIDDEPHQSDRKERSAFFKGETIWLKPDQPVRADMVALARQAFDRYGSPIIEIILNEAGKDVLAKLTRENVGGRLAFMVDGLVLATPKLVMPIVGGRGQINGPFTVDEAKALARAINKGAAR